MENNLKDTIKKYRLSIDMGSNSIGWCVFKLDDNDKDAKGRIESFLDARGGVESFDFTPPGDSSGKYICRNWSKSIPYLNRATIQATFEQVFEA